MGDNRIRFDLTSADTKIIGTDYQFFYFISSILSIKKGESVGYEVKDDVHISLPSGGLVLIQVKHTTQKNAQGQPINLAEKDNDLWKTLSNWALLICDTNDGRGTFPKQKDFIENTKFILATNKSDNSANQFLANYRELKSGKQELKGFETYLRNLLANSIGELKTYIEVLLNMDNQLLYSFLQKIEIEFDAENIIESIKTQIGEKNIGLSRINDVFNGIFSELKQDFFNKVQNGLKQIITYDEWYTKYTGVFENHRTTNLPIRRFHPAVPHNNLNEQIFIKELIKIGDIDENDTEQIALFTSYMLEIKLNLQQWYDDGEITNEQKDRFHSNAITYWRNIHGHCHRSTGDDKSLDITHANNCLYELRKKELKINNTELDIEISNGEFYHLSNDAEIGWLKKWEVGYKK